MVSSFRLIKPAVQQSLQHRDLAEPVSAVAPCDNLGKRIRSVAQACLDCRQNKVKCDGRRPQCSTCATRLRPCRYELKPKRAALKLRLQAFEKVFSALQAKPAEDADMLLQQIRSTDDISDLLDLQGDVSPPTISGSSSASPRVSKFSSPTIGTMSEEQSVRSSPSSCESASTRLLHKSDDGLGNANLPTSAPTQRELSIHAPASLISLVIPSASTTQAAVESFFSSSGRLFHVFSPEQTSNYHNAVFGSDACTLPRQKAAICCLAAVAAVGVQYNGDDFALGMESVFYDVARHFFETLMEEQPLDAIKTCTLLAMYNVMNKATVSLAYIDIGLSMSKRHGLNEKSHYHPGLSQDDWIDYRRTWRTLMFLSSWLSSTLGYIRGGDISFRELAPLVDVEGDHSCDISHMVQTEMTKISLLNADILRMHLSSEDITTKAIDFINKDLQDWHDLLPSQMHLPNLCREDLPVEVRRSILATHLLYLGTRMLLYRRIASQFVRSAAAAQEDNIVLGGYEDHFLSHADQGVTAARQSARILGLLQAEQGIFKRCWLVIFQSYTSCVVLLHCVAQKQVHDFPPSSWQDDLAQARVCLDVIFFCSALDSVARKFHDCVLPIHDRLASYNCAPASTSTLQNPPSLAYMLRVPATADADRVSLSLKLLMILCQPFSNINGECGSEDNLGTSLPNTAAHSERAQPGDILNWRLESCLPVRWDPEDVGGLGASALLEGDNRFLGSHHPSGWARVEVEDEWEEPDLVSC